jgi:hypothetical protein
LGCGKFDAKILGKPRMFNHPVLDHLPQTHLSRGDEDAWAGPPDDPICLGSLTEARAWALGLFSGQPRQ